MITCYINRYFSALLSVVFCLIGTFPAIISEGRERMETDKITQQQRLEELSELYSHPDYTPLNENVFCNFDYNKALADGVKFNELSFIATHNSYQLRSNPAYSKLMQDIETVSFGLKSSESAFFQSDTLTEQFNLGIRSVELDIETKIENGKVGFVCMHSPLIDGATSCYDFALTLQEIKMWSDANPEHIPITVIIEPKKVFIPDTGMRLFNMKYANELDILLREAFGDKLITPCDMMGRHSSLKAMREADDWMTLEECKGKVMFLLHDTNVTDKYISQDKSLKTQAMFPMLRYKSRDMSYASFLLINKPEDAVKQSFELIDEKKLIIRTRVDSYGSYNDEDTANALTSRAQIMSTDYPTRTNMTNTDRHISFNSKTIALTSNALTR